MKLIYYLPLMGLLVQMHCTSTKNETGKSSLMNSSSVELQETHWILVELNGQPITHPVTNQKEVYIELKKESNRLQGSGGCNTLSGMYELSDGNGLRFSQVASTRMVCPDMTVEQSLNEALLMTDNYVINGKILMLHKAKMEPLAKFEAQ